MQRVSWLHRTIGDDTKQHDDEKRSALSAFSLSVCATWQWRVSQQ